MCMYVFVDFFGPNSFLDYEESLLGNQVSETKVLSAELEATSNQLAAAIDSFISATALAKANIQVANLAHYYSKPSSPAWLPSACEI